MMGSRTLSASWTTLPLAGTVWPLTWARMSPICLTLSSIWGWKLQHHQQTHNMKTIRWRCWLQHRICSHAGINTQTWLQKCGWGRPWHCWVCSAAPSGSHLPPSWAGRRWTELIQGSCHISKIPTITVCVETYIFASHGLKHLLQLNPELLDVIDDDTRLSREREKKSLHTNTHTNTAFCCNQSRLVLLTFFIAS